MSEITPQTFPKYTPNPLFAGMPQHLKDPANYKKIKKLIIESLAGKHSHGEIIEWAACSSCQRRFAERGDVLKKLGFRSTAQYMAWQRVHEQMQSMKRDKLR